MKKVIALISFFLSVGCFAQTEVTRYVPGITADGVTYFLPKTIVEVQVDAENVKYIPGEFCKYAERYLRLNGISDQPQDYWQINSIKVNTIGIPDPDNAYSIKLKDKTSAPLVELTNDGIIKSINTSVNNKTIPASTLTPAAKKKKLNARDFMTEEILTASSSAKMAELVAKEIYNIRESKNAILRGQADNMPKDGESLKLMLSNLEEQEQAMMEMFTGTTEKEIKTFTLRLVPNKDLSKEVLFRFSKLLGVVANNDLAGAPVYVNLTDLGTVPSADPAKKEKKKMDGVIYNVPGKARLTIYTPQKKYYEGEVTVSQFGTTEVLSDNLFNKRMSTKVIFDTATGGLIKLEE